MSGLPCPGESRSSAIVSFQCARSSAWVLEVEATNHLSLTVTEGRKSSLKKGKEKNQVVAPLRSEFIGFCIGMSSPASSLTFLKMFFKEPSSFFQESLSLARSRKLLIMV